MKWFNNRKVSVKVFMASSIFLMLLIVISFEGITAVLTANEHMKEFYNDNFVAVNRLNRVLNNILQIRANMLQSDSVILEGTKEEYEDLQKDTDNLTAKYMMDWNDYSSGNHSSEEKRMMKEWEELVLTPRETRVKLAAAFENKKMKEADRLMDKWRIEFEMLRDKTNELITFQMTEAGEIILDQEKITRRTVMLALIVLGGAVIFGIFITIILARSVSKPVESGLEFARNFAGGDLTARFNLDQKDELGQLAVGLNDAVKNIEEMVSGVIMASQNLAQAVEQISSGNQNLSQRTSEQASSLEEIASTIEESGATTNQNSSNADEANTLAEKTFKLAEDGGRISSEAVKGINEINDVSKKISDITNVINEISFQTNLLALNAAVEAARAGDAGRGFAVVAAEIRNLAQRSGNAAREIGSLIKDTISKISAGAALVMKSGESLIGIIKSVNDVTRIVGEINAASTEQKAGMDQLNIAVTELDNMTQQNAALVEETASASEEMANQAQELIQMTSRFKVGNGRGDDDFIKKESHLKNMAKHIAEADKNAPKLQRREKVAMESHNEKERKDHHETIPAKNKTVMNKVLLEEGFEQF